MPALLDSMLSKLHLDTNCFNTHSFCIGAATSAAHAHIPDTYIKMLGRWQSDTYQCYIKTPPQELAMLSKQLATLPKLQEPWTGSLFSVQYCINCICPHKSITSTSAMLPSDRLLGWKVAMVIGLLSTA